MPWFLVLFLLISPLWGASAVVLTEDSSCIPSVMQALDPTLSDDVVEDVQRCYQTFTIGNNKLDAHPLWRLGAALRAVGDDKAEKLYQNLLQQGHQRNQTLLGKINLSWGTQAMNEVEQKIIQDVRPVAPHQTLTEAYVAGLVPVLGEYWDGDIQGNDTKLQSLPGIFWPQKMVEEEARQYIVNSRLLCWMTHNETETEDPITGWMVDSRPEMERPIAKGLRTLIRRAGKSFREEAHLRENLLYRVANILMLPKVGPSANYPQHQHLPETWLDLCHITNERKWADFLAWADPKLGKVDPSHKALTLRNLAKVRNLVGKDQFADFMTWAEPIQNSEFQARASRRSSFPARLGPQTSARPTEAQYSLLLFEGTKDLAEVWNLVGKNQIPSFMAWAGPIIESAIQASGSRDLIYHYCHTLRGLAEAWVLKKNSDFMQWEATLPIDDPGNAPMKLILLAKVWNLVGKNQISNFMDWVKPQISHLASLSETGYLDIVDIQRLEVLAEVFHLVGEDQIPTFTKWAHDNKTPMEESKEIEQMKNLAEVFHLVGEDQIPNFMSWAPPHTQGVPDHLKPMALRNLAKVWALVPASQLSRCINWANQRTQGMSQVQKVGTFVDLAGLWSMGLHEDYLSYSKINNSIHIGGHKKMNAYYLRHYLCLVRAQAARDEGNKDGKRLWEQASDNQPFTSSSGHQTTAAVMSEQQMEDAASIAFNALRQIKECGPNLQALLKADKKPELWRIYKAMYDDFYGRIFGKLVLKDKKTGAVVTTTTYDALPQAEEEIQRTLKGMNSSLEFTVEYEDLQPNRVPLVELQHAKASSGILADAVEFKFFQLLKQEYEDQRGLED